MHTITFRQARGVLGSAGPIAVIAGLQGAVGSVGILGIAVAATMASLGLATLRWWRFSYRLDGHQLVVRQGFVSRSERAVPLDRVRGVDIEAPPLHRLLGLVVLHVDAAAGTGGKDEAVLDAVSTADARLLRASLLARPAEIPAGPQATEPAEVVYARLDPRWLLYAPLVGSYLAVPLALSATLLRDVDRLPIPPGLRQLLQLPQRADAGRIVLTVLVAAAVVLLGALLAGAVANWGFVLVRRGDNLVAERGLLTRRTVTLEVDRIRGYVLSEGLGVRLVRAARLTALVTGLGDSNRRGQLLPLGPRRVAEEVAAAAVRRFQAPLLRHPAAALRRRLVRTVLAPFLIAVILLIVGEPVAAGIAGLVAVLGVALGLDRYRSLGHAADAHALCSRSGSLARRRVVLERRALVGWRIRQSWFQRRAGLVTLTPLVGAGQGGYDVVDCGLDQALALATASSPGWTGPLEVPASAG